MRYLLLTPFLATVSLAQEPIPPTMQRTFHNMLQRIKQVPAKVFAPPSKTCAVPLLNVLPKGKPIPMPTITPADGKFHMKEVQVPAPSCDDMKK